MEFFKMNNVEKFNIRDFGARPSSENIYNALVEVTKAAKQTTVPAEILFEPNQIYRISLSDDLADQTKFAWSIKNAKNLTINGQGSTLLITHPEIGAISIENSSHITLKNFKIDYDPLPYSQGIITAVNLSEGWFEMEIDKNFPEPDKPYFHNAMAKWGLTVRPRANGRHCYGPTPVIAERWKKTGDRIWRFYSLKDGDGYSGTMASAELKPGDPYVHMARNGKKLRPYSLGKYYNFLRARACFFSAYHKLSHNSRLPRKNKGRQNFLHDF
jgi:hypothetical protein